MSASLPIVLQKSFCTEIKNSKGRRRGFRVKMWGTSSPNVKLTGDFDNAIDVYPNRRSLPVSCFREKFVTLYFRLLQHNPFR